MAVRNDWQSDDDQPKTRADYRREQEQANQSHQRRRGQDVRPDSPVNPQGLEQNGDTAPLSQSEYKQRRLGRRLNWVIFWLVVLIITVYIILFFVEF